MGAAAAAMPELGNGGGGGTPPARSPGGGGGGTPALVSAATVPSAECKLWGSGGGGGIIPVFTRGGGGGIPLCADTGLLACDSGGGDSSGGVLASFILGGGGDSRGGVLGLGLDVAFPPLPRDSATGDVSVSKSLPSSSVQRSPSLDDVTLSSTSALPCPAATAALV